MIIKKTIVFLTLISLFFTFMACEITITPESENQENTTDQENTDEYIIPGNPSDNPNNEQYIPLSEEYIQQGIKPNPDAIKSTEIKKARLPDNLDNNYMYLRIRFLSSSNNGFWKKVWDKNTSNETCIYPRTFNLEYTNDKTNKNTIIQLDGYSNSNEIIPGIGYSSDTGFSNENGSWLITKFYYSTDSLRTKIYGNSDILFKFNNFVIVDSLVTGELMGHPDFVRYPSGNPLKIIIPMKDYNPLVHKNIAYITVYFEPDKGTTDNLFPYVAVFDGFEPRNLP